MFLLDFSLENYRILDIFCENPLRFIIYSCINTCLDWYYLEYIIRIQV